MVAPVPDRVVGALVAAAWATIAAGWLMLGPRWLRGAREEGARAPAAWVAVSLGAVLAMPLLLAADRIAGLGVAPLRAWDVPGALAFQTAGAVVLAGGLAVMLAVGRFLAVRLYRVPARPLITTGPFALVRHPFSTHFVLVPVGLALVVLNPLPLALLLFYPGLNGWPLGRIRREEEELRRRFGAAWVEYAARTPRFVPRLRRTRRRAPRARGPRSPVA